MFFAVFGLFGGLILYLLSSLLLRKNKLISQSKAISNLEIKEIKKKLIQSIRWLNIKIIIKNNFDVRSIILKLFYCSFWINLLLFAIIIGINLFYTEMLLYTFFEVKLDGVDSPNWSWIGILILNILYIIFSVRKISDYYKLSLRGNYRNNYLKLLLLDIVTLNFLSVIGILIFIKNKQEMVKVTIEKFHNDSSLNFQGIKNYYKVIFKVDSFILVFNVLIFITILFSGRFIENNNIKILCLSFIFWNMFFLYGWSINRIMNLVFLEKIFKSFLNEKNYYYLLITIRFLIFGFGAYYGAIFINLLNVDQASKEFILENW